MTFSSSPEASFFNTWSIVLLKRGEASSCMRLSMVILSAYCSAVTVIEVFCARLNSKAGVSSLMSSTALVESSCSAEKMLVSSSLFV